VIAVQVKIEYMGITYISQIDNFPKHLSTSSLRGSLGKSDASLERRRRNPLRGMESISRNAQRDQISLSSRAI
jgi:hypothetical protein